MNYLGVATQSALRDVAAKLKLNRGCTNLQHEARDGMVLTANLIMQPLKVEIEQLSNNEGSSRFERRLMDHGGEAAGKKNQSFIPSGGGKVGAP